MNANVNETVMRDGRKCSGTKYHRRIKPMPNGLFDIYAVLDAYGVTCPARQHAIKKLMLSGQRGKGDTIQDLRDAIDAVYRSIELVEESASESPVGASHFIVIDDPCCDATQEEVDSSLSDLILSKIQSHKPSRINKAAEAILRRRRQRDNAPTEQCETSDAAEPKKTVSDLARECLREKGSLFDQIASEVVRESLDATLDRSKMETPPHDLEQEIKSVFSALFKKEKEKEAPRSVVVLVAAPHKRSVSFRG